MYQLSSLHKKSALHFSPRPVVSVCNMSFHLSEEIKVHLFGYAFGYAFILLYTLQHYLRLLSYANRNSQHIKPVLEGGRGRIHLYGPELQSQIWFRRYTVSYHIMFWIQRTSDYRFLTFPFSHLLLHADYNELYDCLLGGS